MSFRILIASQKGGVGKSTVARSLAVAYAEQGRNVLLADFDTKQLTCIEWNARRIENDCEPEIAVQSVKKIKRLKKHEALYEIIIADTMGAISDIGDDLAEWADLAVIPSGYSLDDLIPTLRIAARLAEYGVARKRILVVFTRTGASESQFQAACHEVEDAGFAACPVKLPQKDGYVSLSRLGLAPREAQHPSLRQQARAFDDSILNFAASFLAKESKRAALRSLSS